jgi:DNA-binding transcriptional MerR regulator
MEDKLQQLEERLQRLENLIGTKLSQEQARKYIGVSRPTMQRYVQKGILHPRRDGHRLYYNITELNNFCS